MRTLWALPLLLIALAGCLDGETDTDAPAAETGGPVSFSGLVEFGEPTAGTVDPSAPGVTGYTYLGRYGPEPNIGATSDGSLFMTAFNDVMRSQDGGATWESVHTHEPLQNNDPMLWVDTVADRVYNAPMFPTLLCSSVYWSDDLGDSWTPNPTPACGTGAFDHQKFMTALPGPDANPLAGVLHPTVAYICYNGIAVTNCMASYDGGQTWPVDRPTIVNTAGLVLDQGGEGDPTLAPCLSGQHGHPTGGPDGTVAFLRTWSCVRPLLTYSTDSGLTWINVWGPPFPGGDSDFLTTANAHSIDPEIAFTPDGTMYTIYQSHDHRMYLAHTKDLGASWSRPLDITPPGTNSTVFAALAAGDNGRIAAGFVASGDHTGSSTNAPADARWHMHFVTSENADSEDPTFTAYQATPDDDPIQVGPILQGGGTDNTRNLLDFIDGAVDPDGHFYVAHTVGCTPQNGCSDLPRDEQTDAYRASDAAVAWLKGWSLYEDGDGSDRGF